eukprot:7562477-Pyramimonas_sp.AAC.3
MFVSAWLLGFRLAESGGAALVAFQTVRGCSRRRGGRRARDDLRRPSTHTRVLEGTSLLTFVSGCVLRRNTGY